MRVRRIIVALGAVSALAVTGCSDPAPSPSTTSATSTSSAHHTTPAAPNGGSQGGGNQGGAQQAPHTTTHATPAPTHPQAPATTTPRDDDPGGQPCTTSTGARGKYGYDDATSSWVCVEV